MRRGEGKRGKDTGENREQDSKWEKQKKSRNENKKNNVKDCKSSREKGSHTDTLCTSLDLLIA